MGESVVRRKKLELPSTPVQELIKSSSSSSTAAAATNLIPQGFIISTTNLNNNNNNNGASASLAYMDTPLIDLHLLLHSSSPDDHDQLRNLRSLLSSWGCFQLVNHGVSSFEMDRLREITKEFFDLPIEEKQKYSRTADWLEGYGNDAKREGPSPFNWNDRLHLRTYPLHQRNLNLWPLIPSNFREILDEYCGGMKELAEKVLKAIAKALDVEENSFSSEVVGDESMMNTRFNLYPPCPTPDRVHGLKPHSDSTLITILLQDEEVEGLQVFKDDQWFKVPTVPHAFFINVGDQLEIMSNGIAKSVVHKVVTDKERERISVAVSCFPSPDKEIGPLPGLIDRQGGQLYKKVTNYFKFFLTFIARDQRALNALKM